MKRTSGILLVLFILLTFTACHAEKTAIEDCEWKVDAVMSNDPSLADSTYVVIAVGAPDEIYPDAPIVNILMTATDGKITMTDITNDKVYNGTYKKTATTPASFDYEIEIDGHKGYATVAATKYYNGTEVPTLPINLGEYTIYLTPNE